MSRHGIISLLAVAAFACREATQPISPDTSPLSFQEAGFTSCGSVTEIPEVECEALVALYNSTDGPNWTNNTGWLQTTSPCSWFGIQCYTGSVIGIDLTENALTGTIPAVLGNLQALSGLNLRYNQLNGPIPPQLGDIPVVNLNLRNNQLSGPIPPELGNIRNGRSLVRLELNNNQLVGPIPPEVMTLADGSLRYLDLSTNQLTGPIPAEFTGDEIDFVFLYGNLLSGPVPLLVALERGREDAGGEVCIFVPPGNEQLYFPDTPEYRAADQENDGVICGLGFSTQVDIVIRQEGQGAAATSIGGTKEMLIVTSAAGVPSAIQCEPQTMIAVAVLTAADFDARTVDHRTVRFEGARELHVNRRTGQPLRHEGDEDGDGDLDLGFHFRFGETNLSCESTQASLTGLTIDGSAIAGTGAIVLTARRGGGGQ